MMSVKLEEKTMEAVIKIIFLTSNFTTEFDAALLEEILSAMYRTLRGSNRTS